MQVIACMRMLGWLHLCLTIPPLCAIRFQTSSAPCRILLAHCCSEGTPKYALHHVRCAHKSLHQLAVPCLPCYSHMSTSCHAMPCHGHGHHAMPDADHAMPCNPAPHTAMT